MKMSEEVSNAAQGLPGDAVDGASDAVRAPQSPPPTRDGGDAPAIFAERLEGLMTGFAGRCDELGIGLAMAVAVDPTTGEKSVFCVGSTYHLAALTNDTLASLRAQVLKELGG